VLLPRSQKPSASVSCWPGLVFGKLVRVGHGINKPAEALSKEQNEGPLKQSIRSGYTTTRSQTVIIFSNRPPVKLF
jgi:hypothetical protein